MVSLDLLSCHGVFDAVSHSVRKAIASVTLLYQCSLSLVALIFLIIFVLPYMDVKTRSDYSPLVWFLSLLFTVR